MCVFFRKKYLEISFLKAHPHERNFTLKIARSCFNSPETTIIFTQTNCFLAVLRVLFFTCNSYNVTILDFFLSVGRRWPLIVAQLRASLNSRYHIERFQGGPLLGSHDDERRQPLDNNSSVVAIPVWKCGLWMGPWKDRVQFSVALDTPFVRVQSSVISVG